MLRFQRGGALPAPTPAHGTAVECKAALPQLFVITRPDVAIPAAAHGTCDVPFSPQRCLVLQHGATGCHPAWGASETQPVLAPSTRTRLEQHGQTPDPAAPTRAEPVVSSATHREPSTRGNLHERELCQSQSSQAEFGEVPLAIPASQAVLTCACFMCGESALAAELICSNTIFRWVCAGV